MKQNLRKIEILLFLSLLSFVLAILETKWELFFSSDKCSIISFNLVSFTTINALGKAISTFRKRGIC